MVGVSKKFGAVSRSAYPCHEKIFLSASVLPRLLLIFICVFFLGCNRSEILSGLSARQSIKALVILHRHGIDAVREDGAGGTKASYKISVADAQYKQAMEILFRYNLPQEQSESIEELTRKQGFVPLSDELSRFRIDHALSLQLERVLETFPGVVEVKAVVRTQLARNALNPSEQPESQSRASLIIKTEDGFVLDEGLRNKLFGIITRSVPGLRSENVEFVNSPVSSLGVEGVSGIPPGSLIELPLPFNFRVSADDSPWVRERLWALLLIAISASLVLGFVMGRWRRKTSTSFSTELRASDSGWLVEDRKRSNSRSRP